MKKKLLVLVVCVLSIGFIAPLAVGAAEQHQLVPEEGYETGDYSLQVVEGMVIFVGKAILGLSGSFALAMLVWGGIQMIIAAGRPKVFDSGRETAINALIGLAIIFCSYMIISFVLRILGADTGLLNDYVSR